MVNLDDIIEKSDSIYQSWEKSRLVLQRLKLTGLMIKLFKYRFLKKQLKFPGYVNEEGITPCDNKGKAVTKISTPKRVDDVRSFIRIAGFCRAFTRNSARLAEPLTILAF